jgi:hypothetical protein
MGSLGTTRAADAATRITEIAGRAVDPPRKQVISDTKACTTRLIYAQSCSCESESAATATEAYKPKERRWRPSRACNGTLYGRTPDEQDGRVVGEGNLQALADHAADRDMNYSIAVRRKEESHRQEGCGVKIRDAFTTRASAPIDDRLA